MFFIAGGIVARGIENINYQIVIISMELPGIDLNCFCHITFTSLPVESYKQL